MNVASAFSFFAVLILLSSGGLGQTILYSENFSDADKFPDGYSVSDGIEWVTNDSQIQNVISENGVAYGFGDSSRVGILGYSAPVGAGTGGTAYLGTSIDRDGSNLILFQVDQMIAASTSTRPNDDSFGWTIRSGSVDLVRAIFTPKTSNLGAGETKDNTLKLGNFSFDRNAIYRLKILLDLSAGIYEIEVASAAATGEPSVLSVNSPFVKIITDSLLNTAYGNDIFLNATWDLEDKTIASTGPFAGDYNAPGNNYMAFTNLKVENVPEPATGSMMLTALVAWTFFRRKRS